MTEQPLAPAEVMNKLLASMEQLGASDLHLKVGYSPFYRVAGHLRKTHLAPIPDSRHLDAMIIDLIPESRREEFRNGADLDFSARGVGGDRYRINVFESMGDRHAAVRRVQSRIPTFSDLNLPAVYADTIAKLFEGLILISGVTGCGKSSTLAAMLDYINNTRAVHIITVEDPVEYVFTPKKSIIAQREIGIDVADYHDALRFIVRQDPDCILIGELRDKETMGAALQAAETGHLVLGTLHVSDAQQTFVRILEFFPRSQHAFIRSSLANSLKAIMCQRLVPGIAENTRFPATEVLLNNSTVRDKIVREEDDDIPAIIGQCKEEGMRTFTYSLCELVETEKVHYDAAMEFAPNREALASAVKGISMSTDGLIGRSHT
ncbi:MAG: type IV pilus twitching motility protein PilT [Phycisphaerae bacterium]